MLVLSPWDDPIPLTRAWCLYEIYSTMITPGVKFDVVLPDAERAALKAAVMAHADPDLRSEVAAPRCPPAVLALFTSFVAAVLCWSTPNQCTHSWCAHSSFAGR